MMSADETTSGTSAPLPASDFPVEPVDPNRLPTWELIALALGDFVTLLIFAAIGRASHDMPDAGRLLALFDTAVPFMLAFLVVGMLTGLYRGKALFPVGRVIWRTGLFALSAGPLGVALRAAWLGHSIVPTFLLVGTVSSAVMLILWRVGWSRLRRLWWPELP
jgi:hypothetical protein